MVNLLKVYTKNSKKMNITSNTHKNTHRNLQLN